MLKKYKIFSIAALLATTFYFTSTAIAADTILIGLGIPITGDGAAYGEQVRRGAEAAVKAINASGGVLGKQVEITIGDDQCDPKQAVQVANDLAKKNVALVVGHVCSGSAIPASDIYGEEGILNITPSATNPAMTDDAAKDGYKTIFRTCARDDLRGPFAAKFLMNKYKGKKIAIVNETSSYGVGVADAMMQTMAKDNITPLHDTYTKSQTDYSAMISKLKQDNVAAVYIGGYYDEGGLIVRQAREQGFNGDFFGGDGLNAPEFLSIAGPAGVGFRFADMGFPVTPEANKIIADFKAAGFNPAGFTFNAYAAVQAWAGAAQKAGSIDSEKVAAALRANTIPTVIGDLGWDKKGDLTGDHLVWFIYKSDGAVQE